MSLAARCPHCETVFRLEESHLAAARGWVRCGACQRTFDAVVNLVERDETPPPPVQALPDIDLDLPDLGAFDSPSLHPGPPEPGPVGPAPAPLPVASAVREAPAEESPAKEAPVDVPAERAVQEPTPASTPAPTPTPTPIASSVEPAQSPTVDAVSPAQERSPGLPFGPSDTLAPRRSGISAGALLANLAKATLALTLLAALAAQVGLLLRNPLVQWLPESRPWVTQACALVSCELAPVRSLAAVAIDGSSLSFASESGHHRVRVFLRNTGTDRLEVPALELSLTDGQGELLARRVFLPTQWDQARAALQPSEEATVDITLDLQGLDAQAIASFRVLPLYP